MPIPPTKAHAGLIAHLVSFIGKVSGAAGSLAAVLLAGMATAMLAEVVSRNLFNRSLHVTWELSGYAMGAIFFLAAAAALREGEHVRVAVLLEIMPPPVVRILDLFVTVIGLTIVLFLTYALAILATTSFTNDIRSWSGYSIQMWIPQAFLVVGSAIFAFQLLARALQGLTQRDAGVDHREDGQ